MNMEITILEKLQKKSGSCPFGGGSLGYCTSIIRQYVFSKPKKTVTRCCHMRKEFWTWCSRFTRWSRHQKVDWTSRANCMASLVTGLMDSFLWEQLKEHISAVLPRTIKDLVVRQAAMTMVDAPMLRCV
jgi:hypothetical protein